MLRVDETEIPVFAERDPAGLPWGELGAEVVLESTGRFRARADAARHLEAGARKVDRLRAGEGCRTRRSCSASTSSRDYDPDGHDVISNASCTTNCLAPVAKVLHETVGIRHGLMTTIHAYTADQQLVDLPHKDLRRARAAAINLVPTSTGAAKAIGLVIPELAGKLHGFAVRVPIPTGSMVDLTIEAARPTTLEEINATFARTRRRRRARGDPGLQRGAARLVRHRQVALLVDLRRAAHDRRRRHAGEGRRVVRQRVGLLEPPRRARREGARPPAGARRLTPGRPGPRGPAGLPAED